VGAVAALVFILLNGYDVEAPEEDLAEMVPAVARGEREKSDVAVFIRRWSRAL
jgi:death-on-curing protein